MLKNEYGKNEISFVAKFRTSPVSCARKGKPPSVAIVVPPTLVVMPKLCDSEFLLSRLMLHDYKMHVLKTNGDSTKKSSPKASLEIN